MHPYLRALGIGVVAGCRTFTAPAATLQAGDNVWAGLAMLAAAGEYVIDKLPTTPSRLEIAPLAARIVAGGLCGGTLAARNDASRVGGMLAGALGAASAAWIGAHARGFLTRRGWPDWPGALAEDAIAIRLAWLVNRAM
jgi:uncharacterized membrane protein